MLMSSVENTLLELNCRWHLPNFVSNVECLSLSSVAWGISEWVPVASLTTVKAMSHSSSMLELCKTNTES